MKSKRRHKECEAQSGEVLVGVPASNHEPYNEAYLQPDTPKGLRMAPS